MRQAKQTGVCMHVHKNHISFGPERKGFYLVAKEMFIFEKVWVRIGVMGGKQIKMFVSLGVVAAMLPLLLWGVTQAPRLTLQTRAESVQLRLWCEPAEINFGQAFAGRTVVGETTAVGGHAGRFELGVVEDGVFTGIPNMEVIEKKA